MGRGCKVAEGGEVVASDGERVGGLQLGRSIRIGFGDDANVGGPFSARLRGGR
jgi:hypothetical protein